MDTDTRINLSILAAVAAVIVAVASCTATVQPKVSKDRKEAFIACVQAGQSADDCRFAAKINGK